MKSCPLGDLVTIIGGGTPSRGESVYWGGDIPWATVKDLQGPVLDSTIEFITSEGLKRSASNLIPEGAVITATRMALGRAAINTKPMAINQDLKALICGPKLYPRFLLHFILANSEMIASEGKGATVKGIKLDYLRSLKIPLPPLTEQKRIAAILDKADAIRQKRTEAIRLTDDFLKSTFLDMFGDPVTNPMGWEVKKLQDVTLKIGSGATPKGGEASYIQEGISLIRSLNIHDDDFRMKDLAHINETQASLLRNVVVKKGDILLNITGASVCRCALVDENVLPARVNQHVAIIRVQPDKIFHNFLLHQIVCKSFKHNLMTLATSSGATREALTKAQISEIEIIMPPKRVQKNFADIVEKVHNIRTAEVNNEFDEMFCSLSNEFFNRNSSVQKN